MRPGRRREYGSEGRYAGGVDPAAKYELRAPNLNELDAVAEVLLADDLDDAGESFLDADFLQDEWSRPGFHLATDAWVATDAPGTIVAYGQAMREESTLVESWGVVHPEHRRQGIGSELLDRIEDRASEMAAGLPSFRFRHAINAADREAAAMVQARGLRLVRHFWYMQIDLPGLVDPGSAPEGINISRIGPTEDPVAIHAVLSEAFANDWSPHLGSFDHWQEQSSTPSHDPSLWLLAKDGPELVGVLTANAWGDRGWVSYLGVLAPYRRRGIGAALLRHSFATFARRGVRRVVLNVDTDNPTGATALYERVGMRVGKRWDMWERPSGGLGSLG